MGSINKQVNRYDFTAVYTHPDAKVDVVLVHGLNGDPKRTWTAKNGVFWPADLLPSSLKEAHANVLVYGYNADVYSSKNNNPSDNFIHQHAQTLVAFLTSYRKNEESMRNPIIWVCHSLGGILAKRALLYSNDVRVSQHEDFRSIYVSTYAMVFLGTPHTGSGLAAWGTVLQAMSDVVVPKKFFESEPVLLKTLKKDNETLQEINNHFLDVYQRFKIHMVHENHKSDIKGSKVLIVDQKSASPQLPGVTYYGIEAPHSGMCKFDSVNASGYRTVAAAIRDWVREAPSTIRVRWNVEEEDRLARAKLDIDERMRPFLHNATEHSPVAQQSNESTLSVTSPPSDLAPPSPLPMLSQPESSQPRLLEQNSSRISDGEGRAQKDPLFIHPEAFRPNSYFIGREDELNVLHRMLSDRKRRSEGTSAVLIQSLPGGGKTHLARQYVFQHKHDYPGGIYWVRAKSVQEMEYWFWRIAKNEALRDLVEGGDFEDLRDPSKIVDIVRKWLGSFEDWLFVLDGILFDTPGIERFVPDAKNTSLIFTSTERWVTGDHHFDNPQLMELPLMSAQDAQDLLLLEMEKKQPWTQDDRSRAFELVQLLGRLPLMIHVTAQHLKATREPLSRYLRSYRNRPKVGNVPAFAAVWEQLESRGATAALNLMSIVVFFDQHVPVEMLALGLSALDKSTPYKTRDAGSHGSPSLNNTLKVLIAFALVERTEGQDIWDTSPMGSTSSRKSLELPHDVLDLLRVHSVVQTFFIESLVEAKQHIFWLERSVAVFCKSFEAADSRIKTDPRVGLPDDYRWYQIHGRKLMEHLNRFERKSPDVIGKAKADIEEWLGQIHDDIHTLSENIQEMIVTKSGEVPQASIFERTSSASETDSGTASSQNVSQPEAWIQMEDGEAELYQSPTSTFAPDRSSNPYHWHVPYPNQETIPSEPFQGDDEDTRTITPHVTPKIGGKPTHSPEIDQGEWQTIVPEHKPIKKQEYHQTQPPRARNWRDQSVSDPKVSLSRETARYTPFFRARGGSRSSSKGRLTAESEAEMALTKIRAKSPPPPRGGLYIQERKGRSLSSETATRPRLIAGRTSYANVLSGVTPADERATYFPNYSASQRSVSSATSSWTAATLKRLKENFVPSRTRLSDETFPTVTAYRTGHTITGYSTAGYPASIYPSGYPIDAKLGTVSPVIFQGSRTARSSPGQASAPFHPPAQVLVPLYPPGLPVETNTTSSLRTEFPPAFAHLNTHAYHPGLGRIESLGLDDDLMMGMNPYIDGRPPMAWVTSIDGTISAPMSRNTSLQSSNRSSSNGVASGSGSGSGSGNGTEAPAGSLTINTGLGRGRRHSSPLSQGPLHSESASRPPFNPPNSSIRPSFEAPSLPDRLPPSPLRGSSRPRVESPGMFAGPSNVAPKIRRRWWKRGSQSQSPSSAPRMPVNIVAPESPEIGGEAMNRSASAGIQLDGRIIEFGDVPVDVDLASRRARQAASGMHQPTTLSRDTGSDVGLGISQEQQ